MIFNIVNSISATTLDMTCKVLFFFTIKILLKKKSRVSYLAKIVTAIYYKWCCL